MNTLRIKIEEKICYLGLNRPDKLNSLNKELMLDLQSFLDTTALDENFRVLVLYGEGGQFSSGGCLDWMKQGSDQEHEENLADAQIFINLFATMRKYPKPIVVAIQKFAYGGALGLIACADIAIAEATTMFAFKEVRIGLVPSTIAPHIINKIGAGAARNYMLTGADFNTDDAFRVGLVHYITPVKKLMEKTREVCRQILASSPSAITRTKHLIAVLEDDLHSPTECDRFCAASIAESRHSAEGKDGIKAFFEKRKPNWNGVAKKAKK